MTKSRLSLILLAAFLFVSTARAQAPSGHIMISDAHTGSSIYPGISYSYEIYVPQQYSGRQAACLYVGLDGVLCNAPAVMDSLIAAGRMPVTIGVFLQPGVVKDDNGQVLRYARSSQFDATDDSFARFLETEVLPAIHQRTLPDGRTIHLSANGNDRMIFGLSSGGIAAFTAAWHRPDLFARVFSGVGTFVAMRGGNDLQAFVRKCEPRPIRVFLQDGTADVWNPLFGHWYEGNQMLASALEFAGCDAAFDWSDGGHNVRRSTEIFGKVMEWMWRDWPEPIAVGSTHNELLSTLLIAGQQWQHTAAQVAALERTAPSAVYPDSTLVVMPEKGTNWLWQYVRASDGTLLHGQRFYWLHTYSNATVQLGPMAFDADGYLWVVTDAGLQICDQNGRVRGIIDLPTRLSVTDITQLTIGDGIIALGLADGTAYARQFHVKPPTSGLRPKSQGQG